MPKACSWLLLPFALVHGLQAPAGAREYGRLRSASAAHIGRREAVYGAGVAAALVAVAPASARAAELEPIGSVSWTATDGFDSDMPSQVDFVQFNQKAYKSMRDDPQRTPKFAKAIAKRLRESEPGTLTVLDLGTGPYAVLALVAAKYGAKKVYAVEANPEAARRAKAFIKLCETPGSRGEGVFPLEPGLVEVIEGFSTEITLPTKCDLLVAEICGSIASEEGLFATMRDAKLRHVARPDEPASYIPRSVETLASPASYALQTLLGPPAFDWGKVVGGAPIRFNCRDEGIQLLAPPQLAEEIKFYEPMSMETKTIGNTLRFVLDGAGLDAARVKFLAAFTDDRQLRSLATDETGASVPVEPIAAQLGSSLSGLALWPRLVLDDETSVLARGANGEHQKSHWQTVLVLLNKTPPHLSPGDALRFAYTADVSGKVSEAPKYALSATIERR